MTRIQAILSLLSPVESIADIGSDHGYVAKGIVDLNFASKVYVTDIAKGPLSRAQDNLEGYPVEFFLMDGLLGFQEKLNSCVIAGMGGELIGRIISGRKDLFDSMEYFILQPMQHWEELRRFLYQEGYRVDVELLVYEDHFYEILRCSKGEEEIYDFRFSKGHFQNRELHQEFLQEKSNTLNYLLSVTSGRDPRKYDQLIQEKKDLENHCRSLGIVLY